MPLTELPLNKVRVNEGFFKEYIDLIREKTLPFQYGAINNDPAVAIGNENRNGAYPDEKSNALENLRIAAGLSKGDHYGCIFQDSDVYKWLEAASYSLSIHPDKELQALGDQVTELIAAAQEPDGYIDTYFQLKAPDLKYRVLCYGHELYCMGHLLEAAAAYYEATGNEKILAVGNKIIDHLYKTFGYKKGQIPGADGHEEVEIGLLKMYELTGDSRALALAAFFLNVRGEDPDFYSRQIASLPDSREDYKRRYGPIAKNHKYLQCYKQPKEQRTAEGHAVRMLYLASAMARLVRHNGDPKMKAACDAIWENVTQKKMYVTGGVGSANEGEAFTGDYDLPNDTMYCETCASVALLFFAYELFKIEPKAEYMEVLERALYNGVLSGASRDGVHFFYVNPLEVHGDAIDENPGLGHVLYKRPNWYSCACCPPNFARAVGSVQRYIYTADKENKRLYVNLFINSELRDGETGLFLKLKTDFPRENAAVLTLEKAAPGWTLLIRVPTWAKEPQAAVNGVPLSLKTEKGYLRFEAPRAGEALTFTFKTPLLRVNADPAVWADAGRAALQKGPFVYCAESADNPYPLCAYVLDSEALGDWAETEAVLPGVKGIKVPAFREQLSGWGLYRFNAAPALIKTELKLIPYYAWANRDARDMLIWFRQPVSQI